MILSNKLLMHIIFNVIELYLQDRYNSDGSPIGAIAILDD
jgi:hypothetical protein